MCFLPNFKVNYTVRLDRLPFYILPSFMLIKGLKSGLWLESVNMPPSAGEDVTLLVSKVLLVSVRVISAISLRKLLNS